MLVTEHTWYLYFILYLITSFHQHFLRISFHKHEIISCITRVSYSYGQAKKILERTLKLKN